MTAHTTLSPSDIACRLHAIGAFKVDTEKGFRLALHDKQPDAPRSPFYFNLRTDKNPKPGPLTDIDVAMIGSSIANAVRRYGVDFDAVAGIPNAGTPFAKAAFDELYRTKGIRQLLTVRKPEDGSRAVEVVETAARIGPRRVLIVDDLVTSETMKEIAVDAVKAAGHEPVAVAVFLDRTKNGIRRLSASGLPIISVVSIGEVLRSFRVRELITPSQYDVITAYLKSQ